MGSVLVLIAPRR